MNGGQDSTTFFILLVAILLMLSDSNKCEKEHPAITDVAPITSAVEVDNESE